MTEKELHRLRRQDLLQLLLSQGKEALELQAKLNDTSSALIQTKADYDRLREKLDEKDALIEKLKGRLDAKDARIGELKDEMEAFRLNRKIQIEKAGSLAEAVLRLNGIFETAQKAADQYLYNLRQISGEESQDPCGRESPDSGPKEGTLSSEEGTLSSGGEGRPDADEKGRLEISYEPPGPEKEEEPRNADE